MADKDLISPASLLDSVAPLGDNFRKQASEAAFDFGFALAVQPVLNALTTHQSLAPRPPEMIAPKGP